MAEPIEKNIDSAVQKGPDAVTAYIRGDETSERAAQVDRAHEALDRLKADNLGIDNENKKPILKAIIGQLDGMKLAGLKDVTGTKPNLDTLEKRLLEAKNKALAQERTMAVGSEVLTNEVREVVTDIKGMDTNALKSVGIFVGIPVLVGYLTKSLFGKGDGQNKPGIVRRFFSWMAGIGIGVAAFMGLRMGSRAIGDAKGAIDEMTNIPKRAKEMFDQAGAALRENAGPLKPAVDVGIGIGNAVNKNAVNAATVVSENAKFVTELIAQKNFKDATVYVMRSGGHVVFEDGKAMLNLAGETFLLPAESVLQIGEWLVTGEQPEDFWIVYGEAGAAYLIGRSALNLLLYGKNPFPKTKLGAVMSIVKVGAGPGIAVADAIKFGSRIMTAEGRDALKIRFGKEALPVRFIERIARIVRTYTKIDVSSQAGLLKTMARCKQLSSDVARMKQYGKGLSPIFEGKEDAYLARTETILAEEVERAKTGLINIDEGKITDERLKSLKRKTGFDDSDFKGKMFETLSALPADENLDGQESSEEKVAEKEKLKTAEEERRAPAGDEKAGEIEKRIQALEEQFTRQSEELKQAKEQTGEKSTRIAELTQELKATEQSLTAERTKMAAELETQTKAQAELKGQVSSLEGQLQEAKRMSGTNSEAAQKLETTLGEKTAALDQLTREYEAAKKTLVAESEAHGRTVDVLKASVSEKQELIRELNKNLANSETDTANLKERLAQAEQRAVALETESKNRATTRTRENARRSGPNAGETGGTSAVDAKSNPLRPSGSEGAVPEKSAPVRERPIAGGIDTAPVIEPGAKTKTDIKFGELKIGKPDEKADPREKVREEVKGRPGEAPRRIRVK